MVGEEKRPLLFPGDGAKHSGLCVPCPPGAVPGCWAGSAVSGQPLPAPEPGKGSCSFQRSAWAWEGSLHGNLYIDFIYVCVLSLYH